MSKNYKVYFNERFVLFTSLPEQSGIEQKYWYNVENPKQISNLILTFQQQSESSAIAIVHKDIKTIFKSWKEEVKYIKAAGGLVHNKEGQYMFIFRLGKWDLPKGKMESGETPEKTALREIEEETCVRKLTILHEIPSTYHTYSLKDQFVLKRTYWFEMKADDFSLCMPQLDEHIEMVKWFKPEEFKIVLENTYPSVRDVINEMK